MVARSIEERIGEKERKKEETETETNTNTNTNTKTTTTKDNKTIHNIIQTIKFEIFEN